MYTQFVCQTTTLNVTENMKNIRMKRGRKWWKRDRTDWDGVEICQSHKDEVGLIDKLAPYVLLPTCACWWQLTHLGPNLQNIFGKILCLA